MLIAVAVDVGGEPLDAVAGWKGDLDRVLHPHTVALLGKTQWD